MSRSTCGRGAVRPVGRAVPEPSSTRCPMKRGPHRPRAADWDVRATASTTSSARTAGSSPLLEGADDRRRSVTPGRGSAGGVAGEAAASAGEGGGRGAGRARGDRTARSTCRSATSPAEEYAWQVLSPTTSCTAGTWPWPSASRGSWSPGWSRSTTGCVERLGGRLPRRRRRRPRGCRAAGRVAAGPAGGVVRPRPELDPGARRRTPVRRCLGGLGPGRDRGADGRRRGVRVDRSRAGRAAASRAAAAIRAEWSEMCADAGRRVHLRASRSSTVTGPPPAGGYPGRSDDGSAGHVRGADVIRVRDGLVAEKLSYVKG